jgi:hypothetical protein
MQGGAIPGAIAAMMAGMVELAILGALFAAIGGRPGESVLGAAVGLLGGLAAGAMGVKAPAVLVANFGMVVGAIAGATLRPYLRLLALPFLLLARHLHRHERPAAISEEHQGPVEHQPFVPGRHRHAPANQSVRPGRAVHHEEALGLREFTTSAKPRGRSAT